MRLSGAPANGWLIDLLAEGMWPSGTQLEFTVTMLVIGLPRVAVQRSNRAMWISCWGTTGRFGRR